MNECRVVVLGEEMCKLLELAHTRWVVQISSTACQLLRNQNTREIQTKGQILYMRMLLNFWYGVEDIQLILDLEQHVIVMLPVAQLPFRSLFLDYNGPCTRPI